jgi:hypothetical protein
MSKIQTLAFSSKQLQLSLLCLLLAIQLFVCVAGDPPKRYCGKKLTEKVRQICNNCIHGDGTKTKRHIYGASKFLCEEIRDL